MRIDFERLQEEYGGVQVCSFKELDHGTAREEELELLCLVHNIRLRSARYWMHISFASCLKMCS